MSGDAELPAWSEQAIGAVSDQASRHGCLRARLQLIDPGDGGRRHPVLAGWMVAWDIGNRDDGHRPDNDAVVVPEDTPVVDAGGSAVVRLFPRYPVRWGHVQVGHQLHMRDGNRIIGSATVLELIEPTNEHLLGRWPPLTEVRFREDFDGVSAGTMGVILDVYDDCYEVEVVGAGGESTWVGSVGDDSLEWLGEAH